MLAAHPIHEIATPGEHAAWHSPAWRHELASRLVATGRDVRDATRITGGGVDTRLRQHLRFLQRLRAHVSMYAAHYDFPQQQPKYAADYAAWRLNPGASGPRESAGVSAYLEALLLTDAPISEISVELGLSSAVIRAYEAAYYNVRGADGAPVLPTARRVAIALGGTIVLPPGAPPAMTWRYIGAVAGHSGLRIFTGLSDTKNPRTTDDMRDLLKRSLLQQLSESVVSGRAKVMDMSSMLETLLKDEREVANSKARQAPGMQEAYEMLVRVMSLLAPNISNENNDADTARALAAFAANTIPEGAQNVTLSEHADPTALTDEAIRRKLSSAASRAPTGETRTAGTTNDTPK